MAESAAPSSSSTTTRCARPDCISLREELELLRGDVQELAAENEHLHDTIAQRDAEVQTQRQESARHQEDFLETVAEKDREIERLTQVVHELTASLQQQQVAQRTRSGEAKAPVQGASVNDDERGAQWEQECLVLRGKNAALEAKLVELRAKAQETASATHTMERMAQDASAKVSELYKVLKENELLRGEMRELEDALKRISEIAMEYEATVKVLYEHQNDYREAIDEQTIEITQLHTKIETLEQEKQLLEAKLIDMDERESDVEVLLKEAKMKSDMEKAVLRAELDELLKNLQQQQHQQKPLPPPSASASSAKRDEGRDVAAAEMEELEKQLERLQELRIKDKATIGELNQRIAQQQSDLESLVEHLDVDAATETAVQTAIASEQAKTATMRHDHVKLTRRLKEQQDVLRDMEFRQAQLEKELVDAQAWNAKYEQNAGLEDVMKFQKQLRKQLEKQQHANVTLRNQLNDQVDAVGKLHVAFDRLKVETGKPPSFEYDDLAIENHLKGELAVNQAVMSQMEHQIQELEAERVRLLQKLRDQARLTGHKLYETHGLTTEQWQVVEEFIDRVKRTPEVTKRLLSSGVGDHAAISDSSSPPQSDRKDAELLVKHEKELMTLYTEKIELVQEIDRLRNEVERSQTQILVSRNAQEATITPKHSASKEAIKRMQEQIQQLQEEQEKQKRKREAGGRSFDDAKPDRAVDVSATARDSDDDVDSLLGDDEDAGDANEPPSEWVEANSAAKQQNGTQTSPAKNSDQEGSSGAAISRPAIESPNPRTSSERNDWPTSAEGFAMAVAKALESRLAGLHQQQPPQTATKQHSPQDVPSPQQSKGKIAASKPSRVPAVDNVAFETEEEMTLLIDVMKELNVCLDELVKSEAQNEELQQQIAHHEDAFKALTDQHTILYQHFFHMHEEYTKSDTRLQRELVEMKHENHDLTLKCQRLESSLHLVQPADLSVVGVDSEMRLRTEVLELTRKVAVYEVNEARFRRKYQQIHNEYQAAQAQKRTLENEWLDMEKTLKLRILYLESWKQGADELMERMEKTLDKSVLKTFANKQEQTLMQVMHKYNALSEAFSEMHVKYLQMYDLPNQMSHVQHENALLLAEKRAQHADSSSKNSHAGATTEAERILQARVSQLEHELLVQTQRAKDMEDVQAKRHTAGLNDVSPLGSDGAARGITTEMLEQNDLEQVNALLLERISEVEQLYESLTRECTRYKDIAALAASQANTLSKRASQEKAKREDDEHRVRELMASSEDHAIVGQLQHQLMQLKTNYQHFLHKYDRVAEDQQQASIRAQQLELEVETRSKQLNDLRDKSRNQLVVLETTISQVKERDLTVRNTKWEAFRKRLDCLEDELRVEQERRKELEKELEDKQSQLPLLSKRSSADAAGQSLEVSRLKSRIDALETRERVLMGQLESSAKSTAYLEQEEMLQAELADTKKLNEDVMRQLKAAQARISELIAQNGELDSKRRQVANEKEDLQLELQHMQAQLELHGGGSSNQYTERSNQSGSHSPLMRKKVGLYEKDQAELQQAAQATIASLKLLVEEKNGLIQEYQKKMASVRHDAAQVKAQDRLETTQLNKKLYDENQRMISQLKEAMETIKHLERTGKDKKAIQAAQERHEYVLKEWKQVELALEEAKQTIKELQMEVEILKNERNIAEARAGEALEEIVLAKDVVLEREQINKQLENQLAFVKRDMVKKEDKLKLLREAIIKLKEEFLKAEDRHAIEIAKAQQAAQIASSAANKKRKERREEDEDEWKDEKARFESQIQMLQEKLALQKKHGDTTSKKKEKQSAKLTKRQEAMVDDIADRKVLEDEIERLKRVVKEKVVQEARVVEELEKKLRVLEAQNAALREASASSTSAATAAVTNAPNDNEKRTAGDATSTSHKSREQWELEKKLQRRVDILTLRLKEKQTELDAKENELEQTKDRLAQAQQAHDVMRTKPEPTTRSKPSSSAVKSDGDRQQLEELQRQNRYLHETLVLKRKEWEDAFTMQMEKYEAELKRVRRRLTQHGIPADERHGDFERAESKLHLEEQQFLVSQDIQDELMVLGDELRTKEQQIVQKDTRIMGMELELESLRLEYTRLQRKTSMLQQTQLPQSQQPPRRTLSGSTAASNKRINNVRSPAQERLELEEVIENMKKVIEKLRSENEKLVKRPAVSPEKVELLRRKLKEHKDARVQLETQVDQLQAENAELKKEKLRLQQKLRVAASTLTSGGSGTAQKAVDDLQVQLADKDMQLSCFETETKELKQRLARQEIQIEELQFQLETRQTHDGDSAENDELVHELEAHIEALEEENAKLQNELAAFDEEFFEEIEDLKYKYAQAVREKQQLEKRIRLK